MNLNIFQPHSLKARVTFLTLAVFVIGIWSLTFYASLMLREDILTQVSARQFSTVSFVAAQVNQDLNDRMKSLEKIADGVTPAMLANTGPCRLTLSSGRLSRFYSTRESLSPVLTAQRLPSIHS